MNFDDSEEILFVSKFGLWLEGWWGLEIKILFIECLIIILLSVLINVGAFFFQKKDNIPDKKVFLFLLFDTSQLGVLLFLNVGILNPF